MITRKALTLAGAMALGLLIPLATLRPMAQAKAIHTAKMNSLFAPMNYEQNLPGEGQIQLVGVTEAGASTTLPLMKPWWSPSGNILSLPLLRKINANCSIGTQHPEQYRALAFKVTSPDEAPVTLEFQPSQYDGYSSIGSWPGKYGNPAPATEAQIDADQNGYRILYIAYPAGKTQDDIRVGVGTGPWSAAMTDKNLGNGWSMGRGGQPTYIFGPLIKTDTGSTVTLSIGSSSVSETDLDDIRVVAVDVAGHERLPVSIGDNSNSALEQIQVQFNLPPAAVKSVCLETRPFHWITFHNVHLQPGQ